MTNKQLQFSAVSDLHRRQFGGKVGVLALGLMALTLSMGTQASEDVKSFPSKPIRVVVTYAAGGLTDTMARALADKMSKTLGQTVLVENKPGAGGIIGTDYVAKSAPDGYTITLALSNAIYTNQFIYAKLPYDPNKDISFIYKLANGPTLMVVHNSVPAKNLEEFKTWIKANSGKVNYGSYGIGSYPHMISEYISKTQGVEMSHAVYKGEAPMMQDLLAGQLHFTFGSPQMMKPQIDNGKLRAIAVTSNKRFPNIPDVPTFAEQGWKDDPYALMGWFGFVGPAGIPKPILDKLSDAARKAMQDPDIQARFATFGYEPVTDSSPEKLADEYKRNVHLWKNLVQVSGAKLE